MTFLANGNGVSIYIPDEPEFISANEHQRWWDPDLVNSTVTIEDKFYLKRGSHGEGFSLHHSSRGLMMKPDTLQFWNDCEECFASVPCGQFDLRHK